MNQRPSLREAMRNANVEAMDDDVEEAGLQAVATALAAPQLNPRVPFPGAPEEERQRLLDAALADAIETVSRHRTRLGRRVCSRTDATITRQVYELLRSMAGPDGGSDSDASFQ